MPTSTLHTMIGSDIYKQTQPGLDKPVTERKNKRKCQNWSKVAKVSIITLLTISSHGKMFYSVVSSRVLVNLAKLVVKERPLLKLFGAMLFSQRKNENSSNLNYSLADSKIILILNSNLILQ